MELQEYWEVEAPTETTVQDNCRREPQPPGVFSSAAQIIAKNKPRSLTRTRLQVGEYESTQIRIRL